MEIYIAHILESSICLGVFYLFYILLFRRDNGFKFIRYFLLASILISMILPFNKSSLNISQFIPAIENTRSVIDKTQPLNENLISSEKQLTVNSVASVQAKSFDYFIWLKWLYFLVMTGILVRFATGLLAVLLIYKRSSKEIVGNRIVLRNDKISCPFSFLHLIFINPGGSWLVEDPYSVALRGPQTLKSFSRGAVE